MTALSRREMLLTPVALAATSAVTAAASENKMTLAMHQNTSSEAGYRKSLEGWARAGIKDVEITNTLLDEFLKTDSLASARGVISDLGLNLVHGATGVTGLFDPNPSRAAALDDLKRRCEMYATMGLKSRLRNDRDQQESNRGRLQCLPRKHARGGRGCQAVQHVAADRIHSHVDFYLHLADNSENDTRGGPSEYRADAGLLSFLVRTEQA
jgi:hypothetical protein